MDLINEEFTKYRVNAKTPDAIRAAIELGKKTLDRYYSKTDDVEIYRIAMGKRCIPNSLRLEIDKKKFYTHAISYRTSKRPNGRRIGLIRLME